jgi:hypothetical protein
MEQALEQAENFDDVIGGKPHSNLVEETKDQEIKVGM